MLLTQTFLCILEFVSPSQEVANMVLGNNILQLLSE